MREIKLIIDEETLSEISTMLMLKGLGGNYAGIIDVAWLKIIQRINNNETEVTLTRRADEKEIIN